MLQYPRYCTTAVATTKTPTTPTSPTTTVRTYNKPPAVLLPLVIPHNRLPSLALLQCPVAAAAVGREGGKAAEGSLRLAEAEEHHQFLSIWYVRYQLGPSSRRREEGGGHGTLRWKHGTAPPPSILSTLSMLPTLLLIERASWASYPPPAFAGSRSICSIFSGNHHFLTAEAFLLFRFPFFLDFRRHLLSPPPILFLFAPS